jgi:hypothetical protein
MLTCPEVMGLFRVRSTAWSMFLSHMSLMVQPAPRITSAPRPKVASRAGSGRLPAGVARARLQPHGHNNNQVPAQRTYVTGTYLGVDPLRASSPLMRMSVAHIMMQSCYEILHILKWYRYGTGTRTDSKFLYKKSQQEN